MALFFIASLFAGYWFRRILHSTRDATVRAGGYHVLFQSFFTGVLLLVIAGGILRLFDSGRLGEMNLVPFIMFIVENLTGDEKEVLLQYYFFSTLVFAVALAFVLPWLMNGVPLAIRKIKLELAGKQEKNEEPLITRLKEVRRLIADLDDPRWYKRLLYKIWYYLFCTKSGAVWMDAESRGDVTETTFLRALHNQDLVELVMQDRSYIGFVVERKPVATSKMLDVGITPLVRIDLSPEPPSLDICSYESNLEQYQERKPDKEESNPEADLRDREFHERVVSFQMSSIRFVRYICCENIEDYVNKLMKKQLELKEIKQKKRISLQIRLGRVDSGKPIL